MNVIARLKRPLHPLKKPLYAIERACRARFPGSLRLPDFVGIGAGQAGSSWMFKLLNQHPDVFVARKKETHYFSVEFHRWSLAYYSSLFEEGGDKICGEITPRYSILIPERIRFIRRIMPDVRLILTIRNPIDRAWSAARRVMSRLAADQGIGFEQVPDHEFYEFFSKEWQYRTEERGAGGDFVPGMLQGQYSRAIDNWTSVFPSEQLLVCFFDDIETDPEGFMKSVFRHIGANPDAVDWNSLPLRSKVNRNPEHDMPERFASFLHELYEPEIRELRARFGSRVDPWLLERPGPRATEAQAIASPKPRDDDALDAQADA